MSKLICGKYPKPSRGQIVPKETAAQIAAREAREAAEHKAAGLRYRPAEKGYPRKWLVRIYLGKLEGQKQSDDTQVEGTFYDAEKFLTERLAARDSGSLKFKNSDMTYRQWCEGHYWTLRKGEKHSSGFLHQERYMIETYVYPKFGNVPLKALDGLAIATHFAKLQNERALPIQRKPLKSGFARKIFQAFRFSLEYARKHKKLRENPMLDLALPKQNRNGGGNPLTVEELAIFLDYVKGKHLGSLFRARFTMGCRPGELQAAKWSDLDAGERIYNIERVVSERENPETGKLHHIVVEYGNEEDMEVGKTAKARRPVAYGASMEEAFVEARRHQAQQRLKAGAAWVDNGYIWATDKGDFIPQDTIADYFKKYLKGSGILEARKKAGRSTRIRPYDARHTHATHLLANGENPKEVAARLGHSVEVLLTTYAHVLPGADKKLAANHEAMLTQATQTMAVGA